MKLSVLKRYACRGTSYPAGVVIEVDKDVADFLMADAPGFFVPFVPEVKALDEPPQDKAVKAPPVKKAARRSRSKTNEND